ncbi:MAG: hypothetical protein D6744_07675, partial [Planctomycetota bacterium]
AGLLLVVALGNAAGCRASNAAAVVEHPGDRPARVQRREFRPELNGRWIGNGISYGPHRDGQDPTKGIHPSAAEFREDLALLAPRWRMLRVYASGDPIETFLRVIDEDQLDIKVMLGAWINTETRETPAGDVEAIPEAVAANRAEVEAAIRLANAYPNIVIAVSVGNETQVSWSSHKVRPEVLIRYIRQVRNSVSVPVTTADDFTYWLLPESRAVADEIDFLVTHVYAMWWGRTREQALSFTKEKFAAVRAAHPQHLVVLGEAGWATRRRTEGAEEAKLMAGVASESEQEKFVCDYLAWTTANRIPNFYFEAFDENWKGDDHPDGVEKHWGLFRADRTPKPALRCVPLWE